MTTHQNQPVFHLYDPSGWVNDPNGPFYYNGKYHMFFQNIADSNKWTWGLGWGHATSTDLLHWQHQPVALEPEAGWYDADGCFSGCATIDTDGTPAILYTGVAKKPDAGEREAMPMTVNKLCYERQLLARPADPTDPDLKVWIKESEPFIADHMSGLPLNCFRDPFIAEKPDDSNDHRWRIIVGSNLEVPLPDGDAAGADSDGQITTLGTVTVYRSKTKALNGGWDYDGLLCVAKPGEGALWECPILVPMQLSEQNGKRVRHSSKMATAPGHKDTKQMRDTRRARRTDSTAAAVGSDSVAAPPAAAAAARPKPVSPKSVLQGAVAVIAEQTQQQQLVRQQQHDDADADDDDLARAMSGCMGLFTASEGNSRRSSTDGVSGAISSSDSNAQISAPAAAAALLTKQQREYKHAGGPKARAGVSGDPCAPTHLFSVSAGVCPAIYWLGKYAEGRFDLDNASGPHALDLGDVLYAPNLLEDAQGRQIIWGWLQEHPSPLSHDYAGCISMPRQLTLGIKQHRNTADTTSAASSIRRRSSSTSLDALIQASRGRQQQQQDDSPAAADGSSSSSSSSDAEYYLVQRPLPELDQLRSGRGIRLRGIQLPAGKPWSLPSQVSASHLDLSVNVRPAVGCKRVQILLGPLRQTAAQQEDYEEQLRHNPAFVAAVGTNAADAAAAAAAEAAVAAAAAGADAATIAATAAAAATGALLNARQVVPSTVGSSSIVPIMGSTASPMATAAVTSPTAAAGGIPSLPHSPIEGSQVHSVLPMLPSVIPGELAATAAVAAAANGTSISENNRSGPFLDAQRATDAAGAGGSSSSNFANAAARSASRGSLTSIGNDGMGMADHSESAAAAAAAAAIEQIALEEHQSAAITYEFATAQLQVLVGPPAAVLKLLKQQQEELAAAAASSPGSSPTAAAAVHNGTMARSAMPTSEKLGFEPPVFPPAPPGSLTDYNFMEAAQAAGVRVLACQLRDLDPDQPFEMRILLDYSILEAFFSTGEALTTRVYRGVPTARAKEASMRKVAAHAATEAVEAATAEVSDHISVSASLANLGMLLQQQLVRSGSGRLLSTSATPRAGSLAANWSAAVGGTNPLSPTHAITGAANYFSSDAAVQGFDSPVESPTQAAQGSGRASTDRHPAITSSVVSTIRVTDPSSGLESPETLSGLGGLGSPTLSGPLSGGLTHVMSHHHKRVSVPTSLHIPYSPKTVAHGSYVQYFSPARVVSARVGWKHPTTAGLPTLAGIMEDQAAAAAAAAAAPEDRPEQVGSISSSNVGTDVAELLRPPPAAAAEDGEASEPDADISSVVKDPSAAAAAAAAAAAVPAEAPAGSEDGSSSKPLAAKMRVGKLMIPDGGAATAAPAQAVAASAPAAPAVLADIGSPDRAAAAVKSAEPVSAAFPGFSPHRPSISDDMPNAALALGLAAAAAGPRISDSGSSSSSTAGDKLTSWFQKLTKKGSRREQGTSDDGSGSISSRVIVPPSFGQAMPSLFSPRQDAPPSDYNAASVGDGGDMSPSKARDQAREAAAHKAAAAVTKPGLQIRTSSSGSKTVTSPVTASSSSVATTAAAAAAPDGAIISSSSTHPHGGSSTYSTHRQHHSARSSTESNTSSQPDSGKSPQSRRNWRSAFVISDLSDDEGQATKPSDQIGAPGISPWTVDQAGAAVTRTGSQGGSGPGAFPQPGTIRTTTPFGILHSDPQVAEFGMYAKVLAPGQSSGLLPPVTGPPAGIKLRGQVGKHVVDSASVGKGSGYVPGAMREVSLVALGGGGVVLRLEAHEMNSMWDDCVEYPWTQYCETR